MAEDDKSNPPGALSDQNREEQPSGMRDDRQHPEPRSREGEHDRRAGGDSSGASGEGSGDSSGASGEGSQSTGHPDNAG